jgi:hypothetical protein
MPGMKRRSFDGGGKRGDASHTGSRPQQDIGEFDRREKIC